MTSAKEAERTREHITSAVYVGLAEDLDDVDAAFGDTVRPHPGTDSRPRDAVRRRMVRALASEEDQATFVVSLMGDSVTAGHDDFWFQSYAAQAHEELKGALGAAGVRSSVRNVGMGGTKPFPNALCLEELLGSDVDVVAYQHDMTGSEASFTSWLKAVAQHPSRPLPLRMHPSWQLEGAEKPDDYTYVGSENEACDLSQWRLPSEGDAPRNGDASKPDGGLAARFTAKEGYEKQRAADKWTARGWESAAAQLGLQEHVVDALTWRLVGAPGFHRWDYNTHGKPYASYAKLWTCAACWHPSPYGARLIALTLVHHLLSVWSEALVDYAEMRGAGQSDAQIVSRLSGAIERDALEALANLPPPMLDPHPEGKTDAETEWRPHKKPRYDNDGNSGYFFGGTVPTCRTAIEPQAGPPGEAASLSSIVRDPGLWVRALPDSDSKAVGHAAENDRGYADYKYGYVGTHTSGWLALSFAAASGGQRGPLVACESFHGWGRADSEGMMSLDVEFELDGSVVDLPAFGETPTAARSLLEAKAPTEDQIDEFGGFREAFREANRRGVFCAMVVPKLQAGNHTLRMRVTTPEVHVIFSELLWWDKKAVDSGA